MLQSLLNRTERQTDSADLKAMNRLERQLKRRRLWDGTAIHHPRKGDMLVHYGPSLGPRKTISVKPDGTLVRQ